MTIDTTNMCSRQLHIYRRSATKDVPANVIVVGNPARVLRQITEDDDRFEGGKPIPQAMLDKYQ